MTSKTPKAKFFPPIKTAASFLRTISKSPEISTHNSPHTLASKEYVPDIPISKHITSYIKDPISFTDRPTASRRFRDVQQLNEVLRSPEPDIKFFNSFYLPTNIEQLKLLASSNKKGLIRKQTRGREALDLEIRVPFEDSRKFNIEGVSNDNTRLREWLNFMKNQYLGDFFKENLPDKDQIPGLNNELESFKVVLRVASQECTRQVSIQCLERGEVLSDLFKYTKQYYRAKNFQVREKLKAQVAESEIKIQALNEEIKSLLVHFKDKEDQHLHEIGILKSNLILKEVDIESLNEHVRKLKANRTYRIKKDLEKYNELLTSFNEYKEFVSGFISEPYITRNLTKRRDSIKDLVLNKFNLIQDRKFGSRLTEEQLIEHEMLTTNTAFIFFDKSIQTDLKKDTKSKETQAKVDQIDKQVLTDEILDIIQEEEEDIDKPEIFKQPNIMVTNENLEEVAFSNFAKNLNEISIIEQNLDNEEVFPSVKPVKRRINSMYRWRDSDSKQTQTEEKIFLEVARQEEEELLDWMLKDRKEYLTTIKKQIFHKKNELSRVHLLVNKSRSMLGESLNVDDSKANSFLSSEDSEDIIESEIQYLKAVGLLDREVEIESWKTGYYYGYEKGKNDAVILTDEFRLDISDNEGQGAEIESAPVGSESKPEVVSRTKTKRNSLIADNIHSLRKGTKVKEFHFQNKDSKPVIKSENNTLKHKYIEEFIQEPSKSILKQAKMSRKMLIKTIVSLYTAGTLKKVSSEFKDLATFTYEEFSARFGQQIVTKKLVEFLASLLKYPDSRKTINFVKLIGIGNKIGLDDYARPKECFEFLLDLLAALQKSNLGIIVDAEEGLDYQFIPAIRAVECSKELLGKYVDSGTISAVITRIEANSHPDPKKINKFGIIDQDYLIEMLLIELDSHYSALLKPIWTVIEALYSSKNLSKLYKYDFILMIRFISPEKFNSFQNLPENLNKLLKIEENSDTIPIQKAIDFCLQSNLLSPKDFEAFISSYDECQSLQIIKNDCEAIKKDLNSIFERKNSLGLSNQYAYEWESRYEKLVEGSQTKAFEIFIVWSILTMEVKRLSLS